MRIIQNFKYGPQVGPYAARSLYSMYQLLKLRDIYESDHFKGWTKEEIINYYLKFLYPILEQRKKQRLASERTEFKKYMGQVVGRGILEIALGYFLGYLIGIALVAYLFLKYVVKAI